MFQMLELDEIADRLIGSDEEGGLSLEQRKRTTLGVELAANPSLIFLDEPTSGLDARSAQVGLLSWRFVVSCCCWPRLILNDYVPLRIPFRLGVVTSFHVASPGKL